MKKNEIILTIVLVIMGFGIGIPVGMTFVEPMIIDQLELNSILIEQLEDELQEKIVENRKLSQALVKTIEEYTELSIAYDKIKEN